MTTTIWSILLGLDALALCVGVALIIVGGLK